MLLRDTVHQISRGESADTKFNRYLPVDLTSLNVSNSRFRKPVMFWRWRRHGVALWRHGRGAWHNCLPLATASKSTDELMLLTTWLDCGKRVIRKISNSGSRASYGPYHGLEMPNHAINASLSLNELSMCNHMWIKVSDIWIWTCYVCDMAKSKRFNRIKRPVYQS